MPRKAGEVEMTKGKAPKLTRLQWLRLRRIIREAVGAGYNCGVAGTTLAKRGDQIAPRWMFEFESAVYRMERRP